MDEDRFDRLARRFARAASRRTVMRRAGGMVAAGAAALIMHEQSEAAFICREAGVLCAKDAQCCGGACDQSTHRCACPSSTPDLCGQECVDLASDKDNCGSCGNQCAYPGYCFEGQCGFISAPGSSVAEVWRVLTDSRAMAEWGLAGNFAPVVGHRFQLRPTARFAFDGVIEGEVLAVEAPHRLVLAWHAPSSSEPVPVTVELRPSADGTKTEVALSQTSGSPAPCRLATRLLGVGWQKRLFDDGLSVYIRQRRQ